MSTTFAGHEDDDEDEDEDDGGGGGGDGRWMDGWMDLLVGTDR